MCSHQHSPLSHHIHNKLHLLRRGFEPKSNLVQYSFLRRFLSKLFISRDGRALFFISALTLFALYSKRPCRLSRYFRTTYYSYRALSALSLILLAHLHSLIFIILTNKEFRPLLAGTQLSLKPSILLPLWASTPPLDSGQTESFYVNLDRHCAKVSPPIWLTRYQCQRHDSVN